jgi:hypothetical protein
MRKVAGRDCPRVHWCLIGDFSVVPVHASGKYEGPCQKCCSDYFVSLYTPHLQLYITRKKVCRHSSTSNIKHLTVAAESTSGLNLRPLAHVK